MGAAKLSLRQVWYREFWQWAEELYDQAILLLTRLRALDDLDLNLIRIDQIKTSNAESPTCHLFNGGSTGIPIFVRSETIHVFPSLSCIRFSAQTVHGNCKAL